MAHGHSFDAVQRYTLGQIRLFARAAARREKQQVLSQAMAIGIAFGGKDAAEKFIEDREG